MIDPNILFSDLRGRFEGSFWSLLLLAGYVKSVHTKVISGEYHCMLCPVNEEVKRTLRKIALEASLGLLNIRAGTHEQLMKALLVGDKQAVQRYLEEYLQSSMSQLDGTGKEGEQFYHGLCLGLLALFSASHQLLSNRESGKGRFDLALFPKDTKHGPGVVLELKVARDNESLSAAAQRALAQIDHLAYMTEFKARGIDSVRRLGIAFRKKEVAVASL